MVLPLVAEARRAVGHHALALRGADLGAKVSLLAEAAFALAAFRRVKRDHVVARLHRMDAWSDLADDTRSSWPRIEGKIPSLSKPSSVIGVGVANSGCLDLDKDFASLGTFQINFDDFRAAFLPRKRLRRVSSCTVLHSKISFLSPD